jgi:hypothetical protein
MFPYRRLLLPLFFPQAWELQHSLDEDPGEPEPVTLTPPFRRGLVKQRRRGSGLVDPERE